MLVRKKKVIIRQILGSGNHVLVMPPSPSFKKISRIFKTSVFGPRTKNS